ncbi:GTPase ObgE [Candidatus Saccharibacteria bacterium]|nr:GTPase ObgE [Candidatus Saccharibacteria bacterium]MCL1963401.1 GTPase ObgE [Candidatus Saccharibacteria bacterium]
MTFADTARVSVIAGNGGKGAVSFRHEKFVDKGGPDGGDGGKGGDVIFVANPNVNTLVDFRFKPELRAENGGDGADRNKHGRGGKNLRVNVPIGTMILRDGEILADLTEDKQSVIIAHGGDGGFGNAHFKSSVRQAPRIAEIGEPGEKFEAMLELKLVANVGLVGFPNAGKSTFLSVVSNARPEIADYAFTTLTPNLGIADVDDETLLIADIPGLIEGASEGKGLGDAFLKHIERTSVILHLIDAWSDDVYTQYLTIRRELENYSDNLAKKPEIVVLTKCEGMDQELLHMQVESVKNAINGFPADFDGASYGSKAPIFPISSKTSDGVIDLLRFAKRMVDDEIERVKTAEEIASDDAGGDLPTITLSKKQVDEAWTIEKSDESGSESEADAIFIVHGAKIEKFARRTDFSNWQGVNRLRDIMKKMGITHELERRGAKTDSKIRISGHEFTLFENENHKLSLPDLSR